MDAKEDNETAVSICHFVTRILQITPIHTKINGFHHFLEISFLTFLKSEDEIVKQLWFSKRSGRKKQKSYWRSFFSVCE